MPTAQFHDEIENQHAGGSSGSSVGKDITALMWHSRPSTLDEMSSFLSLAHSQGFSHVVTEGIKEGTQECLCTWRGQMHAVFVLRKDPQRPYPSTKSTIDSISFFRIDEIPISFGKSKHANFRFLQNKLQLLLRRSKNECMTDFTKIKRDLSSITRCCVWLMQSYDEQTNKRQRMAFGRIQL
jgi:hypothetical protein